jgi:hypothetical protein
MGMDSTTSITASSRRSPTLLAVKWLTLAVVLVAVLALPTIILLLV